MSAAAAQEPVRIGESNSYSRIPAFLESYRKGWQLAVEEINEQGGVLRQLGQLPQVH